MTTWEEFDKGEWKRNVGFVALVADADGDWAIWTEDADEPYRTGHAPDLASAQSAADAAVEAIHAAMSADLGLVFGVPREVGFGGVDRYAIASDGRLYTVSTQRVDGVVVKVRWFTQSDTEFGAEGVCATVEDAIAAARAHDAARRGQR